MNSGKRTLRSNGDKFCLREKNNEETHMVKNMMLCWNCSKSTNYLIEGKPNGRQLPNGKKTCVKVPVLKKKDCDELQFI